MLTALGAALHSAFVALGLITTTGVATDPSIAAIATFAAVAVTALTTLAIAAHALGIPIASGGSLSHPRTQIDASAPLTQSDPDAAGHPRPRAPGIAASAA